MARQTSRWTRDPKNSLPSTALRQWFAHNPEHWDEFRSRYLSELATQKKLR
ncbi:DUF488 family protein [Acidithiobacillus sp.]|uniref:DUF488 family protein, N3 subclade n=1 Tax=Acidithiobacillus sp. TaxID=1872118 RepID=UPI002309E54B|nr:DUF488 family protein [Acidithiobacillus sp.]MDA8175542.1 DUF488 family protein [Acidithiobacillus sp.]